MIPVHRTISQYPDLNPNRLHHLQCTYSKSSSQLVPRNQQCNACHCHHTKFPVPGIQLIPRHYGIEWLDQRCSEYNHLNREEYRQNYFQLFRWSCFARWCLGSEWVIKMEQQLVYLKVQQSGSPLLYIQYHIIVIMTPISTYWDVTYASSLRHTCHGWNRHPPTRVFFIVAINRKRSCLVESDIHFFAGMRSITNDIYNIKQQSVKKRDDTDANTSIPMTELGAALMTLLSVAYRAVLRK